MSFLKNWVAADRSSEGKQATPEKRLVPESVPVDLGALMMAIGRVLGELDPAALDADVARAKIADRMRALDIEPLDPLEIDSLATGLDRGGWERVGLLALAVERGGLAEAAQKRIFDGRTRTAVKDGFVEAARATPLLTLELLRSGPLRVEELARRFVLGLGASILGEPLETSKKALERLDYGRLVAEAERAKKAAAERARGM
jgi:hypothetical protein